MKAVGVQRGSSTPELLDLPKPVPDGDEVLLGVVRVGIDGTDHEVLAGGHGGFPPGSEQMILGHETVGVVADSNGNGIEAGTVVVPTVRRCGEAAASYAERGEPDMAPLGTFTERGIVGAHGFMAEYVTVPAEHLVAVPADLLPTGFLVEPLSNVEKAIEHAHAARSAFEWSPDTALVLGNGPLGLLALARLVPTVERAYCLGRRDRPDPTIEVIERLGATYVDSRETPVPAVPDAHEPVDLVVEATGHAPHAFETIEALAPNGVGVLLGLPADVDLEVSAGRLHRRLVLENRALVGSVNSNRDHFEAAVESLQAFPDWVPDALVTGVYPPEEAAAAFEDDGIKTVVEFGDIGRPS